MSTKVKTGVDGHKEWHRNGERLDNKYSFMPLQIKFLQYYPCPQVAISTHLMNHFLGLEDIKKALPAPEKSSQPMYIRIPALHLLEMWLELHEKWQTFRTFLYEKETQPEMQDLPEGDS